MKQGLYNTIKGAGVNDIKRISSSKKELIISNKNKKGKDSKKDQKEGETDINSNDLKERKRKGKSKTNRHKKSKYPHEEFPPKKRADLKEELKNVKNKKKFTLKETKDIYLIEN